MEPTTGIEPVNLILTKDVLYQLSYVGQKATGAGNGTRTRNPQLGRLMLWPLSYSRIPEETGGEGRIRTSEGCANGFTARPLWPLGNLSGLKNMTHPGAGDGTRTRNPLITNQALYH
jgi:hypothetical protein